MLANPAPATDLLEKIKMLSNEENKYKDFPTIGSQVLVAYVHGLPSVPWRSESVNIIKACHFNKAMLSWRGP